MTRLARGTPVLLAAVLVASCVGGGATTPATSPVAATQPTAPRSAATNIASWRTSTSPTGAQDGAQWVTITSFDGAPLSAAVFAPPGDGRAPVVIYLHHNQANLQTNFGLLQRDLDFVASLAKAGFVAVALCWEAATISADDHCGRNLPRSGPDVLKDLAVVADAVRTLPRASADRVVLVGRSGGGTAALLAASNGGRVNGVVLISAGYAFTGTPGADRFGKTVLGELDRLSVPVLIVHGTMDTWSPGTAINIVREYADAARAKGKAVETIYIEGADDLLAFSPTYWTRDLMSRVVEFIRK